MKTVEEWSLAFDQQYNNIASDKAPGINGYEKSVFLTLAQESVVGALYNGTAGTAFESTEAVTVYLSSLVRQKAITPETSEGSDADAILIPGVQSFVFKLPGDFMFRTYEACEIKKEGCNTTKVVSVVPVTQDEFWRTYRNPFKGPNAEKVLRLAHAASQEGSDSEPIGPHLQYESYSEIISEYPVVKYVVRYLSRPQPIILEDLTEYGEGLTINGQTDPQTCLLDEALHSTILAEAVRLAKIAWNS